MCNVFNPSQTYTDVLFAFKRKTQNFKLRFSEDVGHYAPSCKKIHFCFVLF